MNIIILNNLYKKLIIAFLLVFLSGKLFSQDDLTLGLMPIVPQSNYTNPAYRPTPKIYVGFPALSSFYLGLAHTGFSYKNIITKRSDDSLELNLGNAIDKMGKTNYLSANINEELFAFGFKIKKNYFSFNMSEKLSARFAYPRDLISLFWRGNGQFVGNKAVFSGIGFNASYYREFAIGFSRELNNKIVLGGRVKYLVGIMNIYTKRNDFTLAVGDDYFVHTVHTDFLINMSVPDAIGNQLDTIDNNDSIDFNPIEFLLNNQNKGFGIDLGGSYKYNNKFTFGVSIIDFGYIKWKSGVHNLSNTFPEFTFEGVDINGFFKDSSAGPFDKVADSLVNLFQIQQTQNSYTSPLTTKIFLNGIYSLTANDKVGLLIRNEFFNRRMHTALSLSYNKKFFNALSASLSYSIMNRSFANIGLGFALNLGPVQTYFVSDNLYCLVAPLETKSVNIHFGINFIFGYKTK